MDLRVLAVWIALQLAWVATADNLYSISSFYLGDQCGGTPYTVSVLADSNCSVQECSSGALNSTEISADMVSVDCTPDYLATIRAKFGSCPYIVKVAHADQNCTTAASAYGYPATGTCEGPYSETVGYYTIANLFENGSALIQHFPTRPCLSGTADSSETVDPVALETHSCNANLSIWYSSNDDTIVNVSLGENGSGLNVTVLVIAGIVVASVLMAIELIFRRSRLTLQSRNQLKEGLLRGDFSLMENEVRGQSGLWNDDVITANRIPRDQLQALKLISRGSFGEVYRGVFHGQRVAVKMLLPAMRDNLKLVNEFLAESKMTALMQHPHIVSLVGIAWTSLSDLSLVLEFMDGGDLRALLSHYEATRQPVGFNRQKATIALQVCHALAYLHSLSPLVIHRDLKSRNILLNRAMTAKLSDFGVSRERLDRTMTSGVGTSLWMAPEVMLGERYDEKADMFSFGVVLSELDVHTLPYARVKKEGGGGGMKALMLLKEVALGNLSVDFSDKSPRSILELGRACVSIDPRQRPSAGEALYKLQMVLASRKLR